MQIDWVFTVKKRLSWITEILQTEGMSPLQFKKSLGINYGFTNARMILYHEYLDADELSAFERYITDNLKDNPSFLDSIASKSYSLCEQYEKYGIYLLSTDWKSKSNDELAHELIKLGEQTKLMIPVVYFDPCLSGVIRESLIKLLRAVGKDNEVEAYFLALTSTARELVIVKEQRDLLAIGASIQNDEKIIKLVCDESPQEILRKLPAEIKRQIEEHASNYCWINTDDIYGYPWDESDFIGRLKKLIVTDCQSRLYDAISRQNERDNAYQRVIDELQIDGELLRLINITREYSYLRTHRTEVYVRNMYRASSLLREVALRLGLDYKDILYLSIEELRVMLQEGVIGQCHDITIRKTGVAYIMRNGKLQMYFGDDAIKLADDQGLLNHNTEDISEIEGTIANMGLAIGAVKIVHDISELYKVELGDVLIASMTIPEFVPAMEIASAFVTDEGGITCHAAILSRELGVPCIIGTEKATKVFHDGDIVVVDANNGIVRVVNK